MLKEPISKQHGLSSPRQPNLLHFTNSPSAEKQALPQGLCPRSRELPCSARCAEATEGMNRIRAALLLALAQAVCVM